MENMRLIIISADEIKKTLLGYDPEHSDLVHRESTRLADKNFKQALKELNLADTLIEDVREVDQIIGYGVMSTPAIVIDEQVKAAGRIPDVEEIKSWLK